MNDLEAKITEFFDHAVDQYQNLLDQSIDPETDVTDKLFIKTRLNVWYEVVNKLSDALPFLTDPDHITVPVTPGTFPEDENLDAAIDKSFSLFLRGVSLEALTEYFEANRRFKHLQLDLMVRSSKHLATIEQLIGPRPGEITLNVGEFIEALTVGSFVKDYDINRVHPHRGPHGYTLQLNAGPAGIYPVKDEHLFQMKEDLGASGFKYYEHAEMGGVNFIFADEENLKAAARKFFEAVLNQI